jgi:signal transduction histidine kinase
MYEMDIKTRKCSRIVFMDGSKRIDTFSVLHALVRPYKNGFIFCDEFHGVFEIKEGSLVANALIPFVPGGSGFSGILLAEDRYLFLGHGSTLPNFAFENKNGKWTRVPNLLDNVGWWSALYNKKDQTYWVSSVNNLVHYDAAFRVIKAYSGEEGYSGALLNMQWDNYGNLWFANMSKQIGRLDTATGIFSTLSETDGYQKMDFGWMVPITQDVRGDLYFGIGANWGTGDLNGGLDRVSPKRSSSATSAVYLDALFINQKPFSLYTQVNELGELSLKYDQDTIRIEAGIIDYYSGKKGKIRYKLGQNGKEGDWQYSSDYIIRYEGLPPGSYRLVVQSANSSNEFNSPEKILMINISPPFWNTWWFRILAAVAVIAFIYGYVQYRSRNLKKQNILLEKKVMQRTDELNKRTDELNNSLVELKATQDQLIQSEKMASLGELTSGIAHEIKNPLNFIKNFSEINMDLITEIEEQQIPNLDENNQAMMESIVRTLKKNSEKINHHGNRIDGIVKGMLQHSRVGNTTKEPVNINSLCDDSLKLAYNGFKAKEKTFDASVETRFDPDLPAFMAVPQDLGRVLLNLINNAFYAAHEKKKQNQSGSLPDMLQADSLYKPTVIVSTKKCDNKTCITVSDNGMGIPSGIINKIFQPFFTTKPTGEGTGLGLSMSYDIITKGHGGELRVKSKEGLGTDFEILLPVQKT